MLKNKHIRRTLYLGSVDDRAIVTIKTYHGLSTASDATRFALRKEAERIEQLAKKKTK